MAEQLSIFILNGENPSRWIPVCEEAANLAGLSMERFTSYAVMFERLYKNSSECGFVVVDETIEKQLVYIHQLKESMSSRGLPVGGVVRDDSVVSGHRMLEAGYDFLIPKTLPSEGLQKTFKIATKDYIRKQNLLKQTGQKDFGLNTGEKLSFEFRTLEETEILTEALSKLCPEPSCAMIGLQELLVNAVEHGNLGITFDEKTKMQQENTWQNTIRERLQIPRYLDKIAQIDVEKFEDRLVFTITDQGKGFDWQSFISAQAKACSLSHGRGIAIAQSIGFDHVTYQGAGNIAIATAQLQK